MAPEWIAQVVSDRPITAEDVAVPLLYADRIVLHDFGTLATNARRLDAIWRGAKPNLFPISPPLLAQTRSDGVISFAGSYAAASIAYFEGVYWLAGKASRKEMEVSHVLEELDKFIETIPEKFGVTLDQNDIGLGRVYFGWGQAHFDAMGMPGPQYLLPALDKIMEGAMHALATADHRLLVPVSGNIPLVRETTRGRAAALAEAAIELLAPTFEVEHLEQVYELREQLREQLNPFRAAMLLLSEKLETMEEAGESTEGIRRAARDVVERHVEPVLLSVERRLREEQAKGTRRLIRRLLGWVPIIGSAFAAPSPNTIAKLVEQAVGTWGDVAQTRGDVRDIRHDMGVGFLMKLSESLQ